MPGSGGFHGPESRRDGDCAHGAARESVLHTVAEMVNWADKYLKQASPRATPTASQPA